MESLAKAISVLKQTNAEILAALKSDSDVLERIQGSFHTIIRALNQNGLAPIEITCFYEELPLPGVRKVSPKLIRRRSIIYSIAGRPGAFGHVAWLCSDRDTTEPPGHNEILCT